ncbi:MAG: D-glycero-beta-D-manno-heptose-7-phosphate kinase [Ignavibacteria bacterium]|nr:D-glycero-beta-D-manno-heptose-7-phosphate kinase [Ignavibacteria bacterium]
MVSFSEQRLRQLCNTFKGKRIAIVGDLMVDRYYWGTVTRVSPEAPVPVVDVVSESVRLGGAANVANNIQTLGGEALLVGLVGDDYPGELCLSMLREGHFETKGIVKDPSRPTTIKTRVIAHDQHVVRIDNESKEDCPEDLRHRIIDAVKDNINSIDGIILEDYNKGTITKDIIREVIAVARRNDKIITVDPKFENFLEYKNVTLFKPNRREVEEVLGGRLRTIEDVVRTGKRLLAELSAENVLLTKGEDGMSLFEANGDVTHAGTMANNVQDVSGAGDTVISTLTMALVSGATVRQASTLANCAGGVVVGAVGIMPVQLQELIEATLRYTNNRNASS